MFDVDAMEGTAGAVILKISGLRRQKTSRLSLQGMKFL